MKTSADPRHQKRVKIFRDLFAMSAHLTHKPRPLPFTPKTNETRQIIDNLKLLDQEITTSAPEWPVSHINQADLAILRLAVFELIMVRKEPFKVVVDEAVELAKAFGGNSSPSFVNGVLGNIISAHKLDVRKNKSLESKKI